jgi:hypothetical protein
MGKELSVVEINVEVLDVIAGQSPTALSDLSLSLVGGGDAAVLF